MAISFFKKMSYVLSTLHTLSLFSNLPEQKIIVASIPKSGTFLLANCVAHLTHKSWLVNYNTPSPEHPGHLFQVQPMESFSNLPDNHFFVTHITYNNDYKNMIERDDYTVLFIYRDPRDQIISFMYWVYRYPERWPALQDLNREQLIMYLIKSGKITYGLDIGIKGFYNFYLPWLKHPNFCAVKFEDLVGPQGGGDTELQRETIFAIARHLDIPITLKQVEETALKTFGGPGTFREGKIGAWKTHFTQEHKEAFKAIAGQMLIDLGYEQDLNW